MTQLMTRPMMGRRWLLVPLLLLSLLAGGCGDDEPTDGPTDGKDAGMDARTMKQQVDDAVLALGPGLVDALDAEVRTAGAQFSECQMSSTQWQYVANIGLVGPARADAGERIAAQVRKAGFDDVTVTPPAQGSAGSVEATKDDVRLRVLLASRGTPATVHNVEVYIDCTELDDDGQAFADDDPGTDYAELK